MHQMEERFVQMEQKLAKVDALSDMVEGISNQLHQLMRKRYYASINLGHSCREGHHHICHQDHLQDLRRLQQHGTLAEFNDAFDVISCKLAYPKTILLMLIWLACKMNMLTQSVYSIKNHERSLQLGMSTRNKASMTWWEENGYQEHELHGSRKQ